MKFVKPMGEETLMRKIIFMLMIALVIAAVAPFVLPLKNGKPLIKWSDITMPNLPDLPELPVLSGLSKIEVLNSGESTPVTSYKWSDSEGNWHFSDSPPDVLNYETVTVDPDTNLILPTRPAAPVQTPIPESAKGRSAQQAYSPTMVYDSQKVTEIMESARNVEDILQQRKEQQDKLLQAIQ